jgi:hypothetical protein
MSELLISKNTSVFTQWGSPEPVFSKEADYDIWTGEALSINGWGPTIDELLRLRRLRDDWDGEGAEAPAPELVDSAITLAQDLQARGWLPPERVLASVNGTIYFEWHTPHGYVELEVTSPGEAECRFVPCGSPNTCIAIRLVRHRE